MTGQGCNRCHLPTRVGWSVACIGIAILGLAAASRAEAGTYTVYSCKTPAGGVAGLDGWTKNAAGQNARSAGYCGSGSFWIAFQRGSSNAAGDQIAATFAAPPNTAIQGFTLWRSARVMPSNSFNYAYELSENNGAIPVERCWGIEACTTVGDWQDPLASSNVVARSGLTGVFNLRMRIGCLGTVTCGPLAHDSPSKLFLHRADIVLEDNSAPSFVRPPTGSLFSKRPLAGIRTVRISAADSGGGVREAVAVVDGQEVARTTLDSNGGSCREPYTTPVPCKSEASGTLAVDTRQLPDGPHQLAIRVSDATTTNTATWPADGAESIRVANICALAPDAHSGGLEISLSRRNGGRGHGRRRLTTRYGTPVSVHARAPSGEAGAPPPGGPVCVVTRETRAGADPRIVAVKSLNAHGEVFAHIPRGASRHVLVAYRGPGGTLVGHAKLRVHAAISLKPSRRSLRNGDRVVLRGHLPGPIPKRGTLVELQARRGSGWQTFGTTRAAGRHGRYRFPYTFTRTTGVQRYRLRAHVPNQSAYPYAPGESRPAVLKVRG